jgi:hypothetical protein
MTPALEVQWKNYHILRKNRVALVDLLNELRFLGAYCAANVNGHPIIFLHLKRSDLNDYSLLRVKEERAVKPARLDHGLVFFLMEKSRNVFHLSISKGAKWIADDVTLNPPELSRLLQKRRQSKKNSEAFTYPEDYSSQVTECKKAYRNEHIINTP